MHMLYFTTFYFSNLLFFMMITENFARLNWIDVVFIVLILRVIYIARRQGIVVETFKLVGTFTASIVALHYYTQLSTFLRLPNDFGFWVCYVALVTFMIFCFKVIRDGFFVLFHMEANTMLDRWGGTIIGIIRALLVCSLVAMFFRLSMFSYIRISTQKAVMGTYFSRLIPKMYESVYDGFITKLFPTERFNKHALMTAYAREDVKKAKKRSRRRR